MLSYQGMLAWENTVSGRTSDFKNTDPFGSSEGALCLEQHIVALRIAKAKEGEDNDT